MSYNIRTVGPHFGWTYIGSFAGIVLCPILNCLHGIYVLWACRDSHSSSHDHLRTVGRCLAVNEAPTLGFLRSSSMSDYVPIVKLKF